MNKNNMLSVKCINLILTLIFIIYQGCTIIDTHEKSTLDTTSPSQEVAESQIEFINDSTILKGTLLVPESDGPYPAIVFLHGSGNGLREDFRHFTEYFVKRGIACLIYDKRGSGESTGSWVNSSLYDIAGDANAAIEYLRSNTLIDSNRVGLLGVSQGGWVLSMVSQMNNNIAFAIAVTGGGATPYETEMFAVKNRLTHEGISQMDQEKALDLFGSYFDFLGNGEGREDLTQSIIDSKNEEWISILNLELPLSTEEERIPWQWVSTYDPVSDISKMKFPVLVVLGEQDFLSSTELALKGWTEGLEIAKNKNYTIKIYPEAGHGITVGGHNFGHGSLPQYAEGYFQLIGDWVLEITSGR